MLPTQNKLTIGIAIALSLNSSISNAHMDTELNLADLNGANGFVINGVNGSDFSGASVSNAGDINNDGIDDIIIGAIGTNSFTGSSFVIFGTDVEINSSFNLSNIDGSNGFVINGINPGDWTGNSVSQAGDINGDGIGDLIIGAYYADSLGNEYSGKSYVVFGNNSGFSSPLNLSTINGDNGFIINGVNAEDYAGISVSHAGDVNGDGIDDLIIGAYAADPNGNSYAGSSYVVFGSDLGIANPFNLSTINGTNGIVINGVNADDQSGWSVSQAGDVNGDGIDDIIIGARYATPSGNARAGSSYVVFGSDTGLPNPFNLSTINGSNGLVINGVNAVDRSGASVRLAGDINGDGIDDLVIAAYFADPNGNVNAGSSYVVFGSDTGIPNPFNLSMINGENGIVINGATSGDNSGTSVNSAGDINADGIDDLIIGAQDADPNGNTSAGSSYVIFGNKSGLPNPFELSNINGLNGLILNGVAAGDRSGISVSKAGDFNNDGFDDLIIGAVNANPNNNVNAGSSYVVFGSDVIFYNGFEQP